MWLAYLGLCFAIVFVGICIRIAGQSTIKRGYCRPKSMVNPRPAGVVSRIRIAGEYLSPPPPPVVSGIKGRRGTREAAIESSYQDDSNQYLKISLRTKTILIST